MALRHSDLPLYGVQFHPEAARTRYGRELIANFMDVCAGVSAAGTRNAAGARESAGAEWVCLSEGAAKRAAEKEVLYV